ncbi:MAG: acyl-CoA dehydrogenase [Candidatus Azotimanducaceae bacterium]|jgi:acyl-CoA dehydrogenase
MNEEQQLIVETAKRIFIDQCDKSVVDAAEAGEFPSTLWSTLEETGLTLAGVELEAGGSGGELADAMLLIREAGAAAAPIPLAEHLICASLLAAKNVTLPKGIMTIALVQGQNDTSGNLHGKVRQVAYSEVAHSIVWVTDQGFVLTPNSDLPWTRTTGISGQSWASLDFDLRPVQGKFVPLRDAGVLARQLGAATRINLMAGAISRVLEMSVQYVSDRVQFGRPLAKFQAIQHQLAILAGEAAACQRCADAVLSADNPLDIAIGKARTGEAVTLVSDISHQVHGAIGYTLEHALNLRTRRLWQWRDEYGAEREWQILIGKRFCKAGADALWGEITNAG